MYNRLKEITKSDKYDFRFIPFGLILLYVSALFFSELFLGSYAVLGNYFRIHPIPYFVDLNILLCGVDAIREGADPYQAICFDGGAFFNYPYLWGILSTFPFLTASNHIYIGIALAALIFLALYFFIGKINFKSAVLYSVLFISPAFMLGIERGNSDLIIFLILITIPLYFYKHKILSSALILFASMLKIFPIGALLYLFLNVRGKVLKTFIVFGCTCLFFIGYIIVTIENIIKVSDKTPRPFKEASYGLGGAPSFLNKYFNVSSDNSHLMFISVAIICGTLLLLLYKYFKKKSSFPNIKFDKKGVAFLMGSGIFLLTCLIGYNWEYRFIFLIYSIPQTIYWFKHHRLIVMSLIIPYVILVWCSLIIPIFSLIIPNDFAYFINYLLTIFLFSMHLIILFNFMNGIFINNFRFKKNFVKA